MKGMFADPKPLEVLLVEDNAADVTLARHALKEFRNAVRLSVVTDGEQALAYLRREGSHSGACRPDLVLLDLNLPRVHGMEVLRAIRRADALKAIRVVILTSSNSEADRQQARQTGADDFVPKPIGYFEFVETMKSIIQSHPL